MKTKMEQFIEEIKKEKLVQKYLCKHIWTSGSSTEVYPIIIWQNEIELQWNSDKSIFDKFINKMVEKHKDIIEYGMFWKSDGSCPSRIIFGLKKEA